jgi:hypothetical protein
VALSQGVGLQVVDYVVSSMSGAADATGTILIEWPQIPGGQLWRVERIMAVPTTNQTVEIGVYGGSTTPGALLDWGQLAAGTFGVAEYPQPVTVQSNSSLTVQVTGAESGDLLTVNVQYALVQKVAA